MAGVARGCRRARELLEAQRKKIGELRSYIESLVATIERRAEAWYSVSVTGAPGSQALVLGVYEAKGAAGRL